MPLSRRRKKKGKVVKNDPQKRAQRLEEADISSGVSLQDLINVLAYQEYVKDGTISTDKELPDVCDEQGRSLVVNKIIEEHDKVEENEDGR